MLTKTPNSVKVAITGGIGSGKSFVCSLLKKRGIAVYDCDAAAKRLMRTSPELQQQLIELIGPEAYGASKPSMPSKTSKPSKASMPSEPSMTLNKAEVARFLLASPENAQALDAIVHPAVARDFVASGQQWMECAILYESGFDRLVDKVIVVTAPLEVRIQRVMQRDSISREKTLEWMGRQWPQEEVLRHADYEIVNDGNADLEQQIDDFLSRSNVMS